MKTIVSVDPFDCSMWPLAMRHERDLDVEKCRDEIASFATQGQLVPVLGRLLGPGSAHKIELICGSRRLLVARHLNKPLLVELRELSDQEAIVAMDIENRQRSDISPYERGLSYARLLRCGHFKSQEDIARVLQVSTSLVSRLLKLAHLPSAVVNAFGNATVICEAWGLALADALADSERRQRILQAARAIGRGVQRPAPREVFRRLLAASPDGRRVRASGRDEVIKDRQGRPLFRMKHRSDSIAVVLPAERVPQEAVLRIRAAIAQILSEAKRPRRRDSWKTRRADASSR